MKKIIKSMENPKILEIQNPLQKGFTEDTTPLILIPNVAEKNILILVEEKKNRDSEFLSYNLMLNSGKTLRDKKKINILTRVVRKKF